MLSNTAQCDGGCPMMITQVLSQRGPERAARHSGRADELVERAQALRRFENLRLADWGQLLSLARTLREVQVPAGRMLVGPGRRLSGTWLLVAGTLLDEVSGHRLQAGSRRCLRPVYPGHAALRTATTARLWRIAALDTQVGGDGEAASSLPSGRLRRLGREERWLSRLAASPALRALYQARGGVEWQRWVRRLQAQTVLAGTEVIAPGQVADAFYVVGSGAVEVRYGRGPRTVRFAAGDFFGEDGVLTGQPRNAQVRMINSGQLLRADPLALRALIAALRDTLSQRCDNSSGATARALPVPVSGTTEALRAWLSRVPEGLPLALNNTTDCANSGLRDLALLLLVHRGAPVQLNP